MKAQRLLHGIAEEIYQGFSRQPEIELESIEGFLRGASVQGTLNAKDVQDPIKRRQIVTDLLQLADKVKMTPIDLENGDCEGAYVNVIVAQSVEPRLKHLLDETRVEANSGVGKTVGDLITGYLEGRSWGRLKTKSEAESALRRFVEIVGDLELSAIKKESRV